MIRIYSDTHFTRLDAFAELDAKYAEQEPRVVALPTGRFRIGYPARAPFVPDAHQTVAHQRPAQVRFRDRTAPCGHGLGRLRCRATECQRDILVSSLACS